MTDDWQQMLDNLDQIGLGCDDCTARLFADGRLARPGEDMFTTIHRLHQEHIAAVTPREEQHPSGVEQLEAQPGS